MKKLIFLLIVLCWSCEDVVDIELETESPRLVVDAELSRKVGETIGALEVKLSRTTSFYETEIPKVTTAEVRLSFEDQEVEAVHTEDGIYEIETLIIDPEISYTLHIVDDNEHYQATEELTFGTVLESAVQGDGQFFSGDEIEVILTFTDLPEEGNYYFFDMGYSNLFATQDRFYNGNRFSFSYFYDDRLPKNTPITIRMTGMDEAFFDYIQILISHGGLNGGSPFEAASSTLLGNVQNTTDSQHYPLGYFRVTEYSTLEFVAE